jgi:hypothetical protein
VPRSTKGVLGLVDDLVVSEACDGKPGQLEVYVLPAIALERPSHRVEGVSVHLDHSLLVAPQEVDLVAVQPRVHLRIGKAAAPA